jgi:hypothetical protein
MNDDTYIGHKLEQILDEVKAVHEAVAGIRQVVDNQPTRDEFEQLRQDVTFDRTAAVRTDCEVADLKSRVSRLEAA